MSKNEWLSEYVKKMSIEYDSKTDLREKLNFLIDQLIVYREDFSFGEYDLTVVLDDSEINEREEISSFLVSGFKEVKREINRSL